MARPATARLWLIGGPEALARVEQQLAVSDGVIVRQAGLATVLREARPRDLVLLSGRLPVEMVDDAETLLKREFTVALEVGDRAALRRALSRRRLGLDLVVLSSRPLSPAARLAFRLRDLVVAGAALLALSPALALLGVLVKRSSPGPVFFATTVVGQYGRTFTWRKLRSMTVGTPTDEAIRRERYRAFLANVPQPDQQAGLKQAAAQKLVDESRVTPIGRLLRRHSLDELPQLWNVLRGEMTLVGPRPCLPYEYELQSPWQRLRYRVTPGLTGPWQAYGRSQVTFDEMALMDYCYGRVKSFWLDARLILRTALVVITGEGGK